jgi:hypothetical protein
LVKVPHKDKSTFSDFETQPEFGNLATIIIPKNKYSSIRLMNAMVVGMTLHEHVSFQIK